MFDINGFCVVLNRISWRNLTIVVFSFWLSNVGASTCNSGLEFECKSVQGDGKTCITGCNFTVANTLSPGQFDYPDVCYLMFL